ncbi:MAG: M48 family metallopeptidase [Planctomycetes bacterium]|nr:M48 family metallopeptidase [Planctomycetota bacterium]
MGPRPSLWFRALLALVLMIGFYGLALTIACGLLYVAYLDAADGRRIHAKLVILCLLGAGVILWSVLPRFERFVAPGPRLDPKQHPRLFAELEGLARAIGLAMPQEVYIVLELNAFVAERGGFLGAGSRRIMGLGLPLLRILSVAELRAVLGHEFGHYHGGETRIGPWLFRTREAIGRSISNLAEMDSWLQFPFLWYGKLFLRITHAVSRRQELAADELAARIVGSGPAASALQKVHETAPAFDPYLTGEVIPVLDAGYHPPLADGFALFLQDTTVRKALDKIRGEESHVEPDPYLSHPPLAERLAAIMQFPTGPSSAPGLPALSLLDDLPALERELLASAFKNEQVHALQPIRWEDTGPTVYIPSWRKHHAQYRGGLKGVNPEGLPSLAKDLPATGRSLTTAPVDSEGAAGLAGHTIGVALALGLLETGWSLEVSPGAPIRARRGGEELEPFNVLRALHKQELEAGAWFVRCVTLGIGGLDLGAARDGGAPPGPAAAAAAPDAAPPPGP